MSRYSNDFRKLFASKVNQGISITEICKELNIGEDTAYKWRLKLRAGTLFDVISIGGRPAIYDYDGLRDFVENYPDKTLYEINIEFFKGQASTSGIDNALKRMKFRLKKSPIIPREESGCKR